MELPNYFLIWLITLLMVAVTYVRPDKPTISGETGTMSLQVEHDASSFELKHMAFGSLGLAILWASRVAVQQLASNRYHNCPAASTHVCVCIKNTCRYSLQGPSQLELKHSSLTAAQFRSRWWTTRP